MFKIRCSICLEDCQSVNNLKKHVNLLHKHEWKIPFRCGQESCVASYDEAKFLYRHLRQQHGFADSSRINLPCSAPQEDVFSTPYMDDQTITGITINQKIKVMCSFSITLNLHFRK